MHIHMHIYVCTTRVYITRMYVRYDIFSIYMWIFRYEIFIYVSIYVCILDMVYSAPHVCEKV